MKQEQVITWLRSNHQQWMPYVAVVVLGIWLWYGGKAAGRSEESLKQARERIAILTTAVDSQRVLVAKADSAVIVAEAQAAKIQIRYIDAKVQPKIDSAIASVMTVLNDSMKAKLQVVISGYEERLQVRDNKIASLEIVILKQKETIVNRDELIVRQDSLQTETKRDFDQLAKSIHKGFFAKLVSVVVPVATLLLVIIR